MTAQGETVGKKQVTSRSGSVKLVESVETKTNGRKEELRDGLRISGDVFAKGPVYETQLRGQY